MLTSNDQLQMNFSGYSDLYDLLIPKDDMWRKINDEIDFSFIYDELKDKYSSTMGRPAEDVIRMFKFLLLKSYFKLSDRGLVKRTKTDLLFKYFLGYKPEDTKIIDASLLSVFRRERLAVNGEDDGTATSLLDKLIELTVQMAIEKGVIKSKNKLIQDSTHTNAMFSNISPREELIRQARTLRKSVYKIDESVKQNMPKKREATGLIEDQIEYTHELIKVLKSDERFLKHDGIREQIDYLEETVDDINSELSYSRDKDAKVGHKTADTAFFGYKTNIALTPERIITAATITTGESHDGQELEALVSKSEAAGIEVEAVIGDGAYSTKANIKFCKDKNIKLASKLAKNIGHNNEGNAKGFEYNKDAEMYVCKAGHMAIRKGKTGRKNEKLGTNQQCETYFFDVEKCKICPHKEGCYKKGAKTKTYSVKLTANLHLEHRKFMETEEFKELYSERYKIEAKNGELKNNYGYSKATACGKTGITIQGASTLFLTNIKRIIKLEEEKSKKDV